MASDITYTDRPKLLYKEAGQNFNLIPAGLTFFGYWIWDNFRNIGAKEAGAEKQWNK